MFRTISFETNEFSLNAASLEESQPASQTSSWKSNNRKSVSFELEKDFRQSKMILSLFTAVILILLAFDYRNKKKRNDAFAKAKLKGPPVYPIFGSVTSVLNITAENMIPTIGAWLEKYGKTFKMWVLNEAQIYTIDIELFESIYNSTKLLRKAEFYKFVVPFINDGLLVSNGHKWHARRKLFTTAFHFKVLENYVTVFDKQSGILAECFRPLADGKTVIDVQTKVSLAALDVITQASMGVNVNAQADPDFPYIQALKSVVYIQPNRMYNPKKREDWIYKILCPFEYQKLKKDIKKLREFTTEVIKKRRYELEMSIANGTYKPLSVADEDVGARPQMAFLDILLQSQIDGKPLTNEEIQEEVDTFMFEGDDTTTSAVSHVLYLLARHPHVQSKALEEIYEVIGTDKDSPITMPQLSDLKYLEAVIKETLRLYPSVPAIGRMTDEDIVLNGMKIPANTSVYLVTIFAQRDPDYYPDPLAFKPERFLEGQDASKVNAFSFVPFSAGARNCIGQKFAMLEIKAMVSKMLRHYELLPLGPNVESMMNFIIRSSNGINLGLKPRQPIKAS